MSHCAEEVSYTAANWIQPKGKRREVQTTDATYLLPYLRRSLCFLSQVIALFPVRFDPRL